jgi:hypothetical protein
MNNLEVIAKMANFNLEPGVFQVVDNSIINVKHLFNPHQIQLTEDFEKKVFTIEFKGFKFSEYSNQQAVNTLIKLYILKDE